VLLCTDDDPIMPLGGQRRLPIPKTGERSFYDMARGKSSQLFVAGAALALALALPANAQLPQGFVAKDIGDVGLAGSSKFDAATGVWTLKGAGSYPNETMEEAFQFAYQVVTGDGSIIARDVDQLYEGSREDSGTEPKGGPMIRATDAAGSPYVALIMTTSTIALQYRDEAGKDSVRVSGQADRELPSVFQRVQRVGNVVSAFISKDGKLWQPIDEAPRTLVGLGESGLFGIALSSRHPDLITTMTFDNVKVLPGQVSISGAKVETNDKGTTLQWDAVKGAVGYHVYRGDAGAEFAAFKKLDTDAVATPSFTDATSANAGAGTLSFAVSAIFTGADGNPVEGPILLVPGP